MEVKNTTVISAYPCCGKTYAYNIQDEFTILDSDSSSFKWIYKKRIKEIGREPEVIKEVNPDFPNNYIKHIKENLGKVDIIFVSSHLEVREALEEAGIRFCTVYPKKDMLNEWVGRMYRRGSDEKFIKFQIDNWDKFHNGLIDEPCGIGVWYLRDNEYLSDKLDILRYW